MTSSMYATILSRFIGTNSRLLLPFRRTWRAVPARNTSRLIPSSQGTIWMCNGVRGVIGREHNA